MPVDSGNVHAVRLNVILHDFSKQEPFGGLKVLYEFANRLSAMGDDVVVYHSLNFNRSVGRHPRALVGLVRCNLLGRRAIGWFTLSLGVRCRFLPRIVPRMLRPADATIVGSFLMAERLPAATSRTGPILHVVYEYPVWRSSRLDLRNRLARSLQRADISHIATSAAVEAMISDLGVRPVEKITCGIDLPVSSLIPATANRRPIVGFPLRPEPYKGVLDMLAAIPLIRAQVPDAEFECFGRYAGADLDFPEGLTVHGYLDQRGSWTSTGDASWCSCIQAASRAGDFRPPRRWQTGPRRGDRETADERLCDRSCDGPGWSRPVNPARSPMRQPRSCGTSPESARIVSAGGDAPSRDHVLGSVNRAACRSLGRGPVASQRVRA